MKMKSAAVVGAIGLALASLSAQAADWEGVANSSAESVFVDKQSIHSEGNTVKAWVLRNYPKTAFLGDSVYPHKSRLMLYEFRCAAGELGYAQWNLYADELASGKTVWTGSSESVAFYEPAAQSSDRALLAKVCAA